MAIQKGNSAFRRPSGLTYLHFTLIIFIGVGSRGQGGGGGTRSPTLATVYIMNSIVVL